jgi:7-carboxy-7-deazaguanine synthase
MNSGVVAEMDQKQSLNQSPAQKVNKSMVNPEAVFQVVEKFVSIDGEGQTAGMLAVFIRFKGCNLRCAWCDTVYSWETGAAFELMTAEAICDFVRETGVKHVTLTGGEPLIQDGIEVLMAGLTALDEAMLIHIETNGSVDIGRFKAKLPSPRIRYVVDYKLPGSGMSDRMALSNLSSVDQWDVYKFVLASQADLETAYDVIRAYDLTSRCQVFFSPVTKALAPAVVVEFMKAKRLGDVRLQLQLHKYIWPESQRGV